MENEKTRLCPYCHQEAKIKTGLQNWKNLFRKPTLDEIITLFIIICVIGLYFAYQHDMKQYQDYISKHCNNGIVDKGISGINDNVSINQSIQSINITEINEVNKTYKV